MSKHLPLIVATVGFTGAFCVLLVLIFKHDVPQTEKQLADTTASLAACEMELHQYYETGKPPYPCKKTNTCND